MTSINYHKTKRRGSTYLMVLSSSMIVTVIGLASLLAIRVQRRSMQMTNDAAEARLYAQSAIELGLLYVQDQNWRNTWSNGTWLSNQPLGNGCFSLEGTDPRDNNLSDSEEDPVILTGTGMKGMAVHKVQITLVPSAQPLESLNTCLHSRDDIYIAYGDLLTVAGAPVSANDRLDNDGTIDGDAEAGQIASQGTITGTLTVPAPSKAMPNTDIINDYINKATWIFYTGTMENVVLTPTHNPWGWANSEGVYFIYTYNNNLTIRNSRIHGTLIVNTGYGSLTLDDAVFLQSYRSYYPALIVEGRVTIQCDGGVLSEASCNTNYNPSWAPYLDQSDNDKVDEYPNEIQGLVHVTSLLELKRSTRIRGTVICHDDVWCKDQVTIIHDPSLTVRPPEGYFFIEGVHVSPGSCQQVVD
ncbi:MAG: hypothetical protein JXM79_22945 [Sedimentisphaerales bacterium]|nr:hypothetical protein [Sedimentisphaerales bacterium]